MNFFFAVLEAGCWSIWLLVRVLFLIGRWLLLVPLHGRMGVREAGRRRGGEGNRGKERGREGDREREKHSIIASFLIYFWPPWVFVVEQRALRCLSAQLWGALLPSCGGGGSSLQLWGVLFSPAVVGGSSLQLRWGALLPGCGGLYSLTMVCRHLVAVSCCGA